MPGAGLRPARAPTIRPPPTRRFIDDRKVLDAIVTSTAQNDAGLFEPTLRDERYLPFEGAGAISTWQAGSAAGVPDVGLRHDHRRHPPSALHRA